MSENDAALVPVNGPDALLSVIAQAAADPRVDVTKMQALVDLKLQITRESAAQEFSAAMARLQPRLPRIAKAGKIEFNGASQPYARYEDILKVCRPFLAEEGFSTSYSFEDAPGGTVCVCTVCHRAGHSKSTRTPPLPMDKSGSKNAVQAVGSTMAYGKRYAFCNAFDIVTEGVDNDAATAQSISDDQVNKIRDLLLACNMSQPQELKFLEFVGAPSVEQIQAARFPAAVEALRKKLQQVQGGAR